MKDDRLIFQGKNEQGESVTYEVLFTFESEETGQKYMAYTDNKQTPEGEIQTYLSRYEVSDTEEGAVSLLPIESEKELKTAQIVLDGIREELLSKRGGQTG